MDTSKEYIKMSDCPKIQDAISKNKVDWRNQGYCKKHGCLITEDMDGSSLCRGMMDKIYKDGNLEKYIDRTSLWEQEMCGYDQWIVLPYQDQLQEMLPKRTTWFENLYRFYEWMTTHDPSHFSSPCTMFSSMEQLWLAFVMWELHVKQWLTVEEKWVALPAIKEKI